MTEDQIKAIAEAYCKTKGNGKSKTVREYNYGLMMEILHWLSVNGYCIVEREKVMDEYKYYKDGAYKAEMNNELARSIAYDGRVLMLKTFSALTSERRRKNETNT
ncbi:MAG: hypothetical protein NC095_06630 [Muribaculum sp.]|nr:hypothetical protein [Muribaculum sp.]